MKSSLVDDDPLVAGRVSVKRSLPALHNLRERADGHRAFGARPIATVMDENDFLADLDNRRLTDEGRKLQFAHTQLHCSPSRGMSGNLTCVSVNTVKSLCASRLAPVESSSLISTPRAAVIHSPRAGPEQPPCFGPHIAKAVSPIMEAAIIHSTVEHLPPHCEDRHG